MSDQSRFVWEEGDITVMSAEEAAAEEEREAEGDAEESVKDAVAKVLRDAGYSEERIAAVLKSGGWDPAAHPRGQPGNAGQFVSAGGGGASAGEPKQMPSKHDPDGVYYRDPEVEHEEGPKSSAPEHVVAMAKEMVKHAEEEAPARKAEMMEVAEAAGGKMDGLDFAVKGAGSLARKINDDAIAAGITPEEAARHIGDSIRFTMTFPPEKYAEGVQKAMAGLAAKGYTLKPGKFKNTWEPEGKDALYQGINVNLYAPSGRVIELQFHTPESFFVKDKINHLYYETYRSGGFGDTDSNVKKARAAKVMIMNQNKMKRPTGAHQIRWEAK